MKFNERLKALREKTGLNQKEFAASLGMEQSKYNKWENGKNAPGYDDLCSLAQHFDCSTDYLLGLSVHENPAQQIKYDAEIERLSSILSRLPDNRTAFLTILNTTLEYIARAESRSAIINELGLLISRFGNMFVSSWQMRFNSLKNDRDYLLFLRHYQNCIVRINRYKNILIHDVYNSLDDDTPLRNLIEGEEKEAIANAETQE